MTDYEEILKAQLKALSEEIQEKLAERASADEEARKKIDERLDALEKQKEEADEQRKEYERNCLIGIDVGVEEGKEFSFARVFQLIAAPDRYMNRKSHGYEVEVQRNMMKQLDAMSDENVVKTAISGEEGTTGAFLIPIEAQAELIPLLEAKSITAQLGVMQLNGLVGNPAWTKNEGGITAYYIDTEAEASGTESVPTFSAIQLRPHVLAAFVPMTWGMLNQSAMSLETWVRGRLAKVIALKEDNSVFQGASNESEPRGITNTTGISTMNWSTNPGQPIFSGASTAAQNITRGLRLHIKDLMDNDAFEDMERPGWALSPSALYAMSTTRDSTGRDIFLPADQSQAMPQNLLGYPALSSSQVEQSGNTAEFLMFADWAQAVNAHWGTMAFASSDVAGDNFLKVRTTIRAVTAHDVGVFQPKAFSNASNFNISNALA